MMLAIEFGSGRRGDCDLTSDRDLLLIGTDWKQVTSEAAKKSADGFSISAFLFDKATYLVGTGNLFFKHICDEGILVSGSEDRYHGLIAGWQAASDYRDEVRENLDLLEVIHFIPQSAEGVVVAVDILISSVRNVLIRRLASCGEYVFSWSQVFDEAEKRCMIQRTDIPLFLAARHIKNRYRQGSIPALPVSYLEALLKASNRACGVTLKPRFASRVELRSLPEKYADGSYKQLRAMELMCAEYFFDKALDPLLSFVRQPAYFCANGPNIPLQRMSERVLLSESSVSQGLRRGGNGP